MEVRREFSRACRWLATIGILSGSVILAAPSTAGATTVHDEEMLQLGLGSETFMTLPATASLGSYPAGAQTISEQLGTITVIATGTLGLLLPSFTAMVSLTSNFTDVAGQTIPMGDVSYSSGPAVSPEAGSQTPVPGQVLSLSTMPQTAFSSSGLLASITTSWDPTITITIPAAVVQGTYSGTLTYSVA